MALGASILKTIAPTDGHLIPGAGQSNSFPYREASGNYTLQYKIDPLKSVFLGKACFVCEHDGKERELIDTVDKKCTSCTPAVPLSKSGQRKLEHIGAHILFDNS